MAEIITDPMNFKNSFEGLTNEEQFDSYYAPKNGQRANETNVGRAPKRIKKESNILRDYLAVLFNRPVRSYDGTVAYQFGEIVSVTTDNGGGEYFHTYYKSVSNDNLGVSPDSDTNLDNSYWVEVEPFGTMRDTFENDVTWMNDVRLGANAHNSGYFIVGERFGKNVAFDRDEIMARSYDSATGITEVSELTLQSDGGDLYIHKNNHNANGNGIVFTDAGLVGIGTLQPDANLHVVGQKAMLQDGTSPLVTLSFERTVLGHEITSNNRALYLNSTESTFINTNGNSVDIGTSTSLGTTLGVVGTILFKGTGTIFQIEDSGTSNKLMFTGNTIESNTELKIARTGGLVSIHGDVANNAINFTNTGSVVIGEDVTSTSYKLSVKGNTLMQGNLNGLDDITFGELDSTDNLTISKNNDNFYTIQAKDNDGVTDTTLEIQETGRLKVNDIINFENGKIGIGTTPTYDLHVIGTSLVSGSANFNTDLRISDEFFVDASTNRVYIGSTEANGMGGSIQITGATTIKQGSGSEYGLYIENFDNDNKITIDGDRINAFDGSVSKALGLQSTGGAICIHGEVADKTKAISITDSGSIVIGKNLCNGDAMNDTSNRLEVYGNVYLSEGIKGLNELILGEDTGSVLVQDRRDTPNYHINAFTDKTQTAGDTLYIQDEGLDTIFNDGTPQDGNPSNYVHIDDNGNVGIGMLNPSDRLQVDGVISASGRIKANFDLVVEDNLYIDSDTVSTIADGDVLYIQRETANSKAGAVVDRKSVV